MKSDEETTRFNRIFPTKFDQIFQKVIEASKAFKAKGIPIQLDFKFEDLRDALMETNELISELKVIISQKNDTINNLVNSAYNLKKKRNTVEKALWIARAARAKAKAERWYYSTDYTIRYDGKFNIVGRSYGKGILKSPEEWYKTWINIKQKCLKKAKQYP